MANQFYRNRNSNNQQSNRNMMRPSDKNRITDVGNKRSDEDLIVEENTIYEIDRECRARTQKQKHRR